MPEIKLDTFPGTKAEALAMLYVQNQDLTGKTPAQIAALYDAAYKEIRQYIKDKNNQRYNMD